MEDSDGALSWYTVALCPVSVSGRCGERVPLFRIPTLGILVGFPMLRETVPKAVGRNERYDISFYNFVIR